MFDMFADAFDFNPFEPGNPMTLGMIEENYNKNYVDGYSTNPWEEDDKDDNEEYKYDFGYYYW